MIRVGRIFLWEFVRLMGFGLVDFLADWLGVFN
jgi:hypothetical protein